MFILYHDSCKIELCFNVVSSQTAAYRLRLHLWAPQSWTPSVHQEGTTHASFLCCPSSGVFRASLRRPQLQRCRCRASSPSRQVFLSLTVLQVKQLCPLCGTWTHNGKQPIYYSWALQRVKPNMFVSNGTFRTFTCWFKFSICSQSQEHTGYTTGRYRRGKFTCSSL